MLGAGVHSLIHYPHAVHEHVFHIHALRHGDTERVPCVHGHESGVNHYILDPQFFLDNQVYFNGQILSQDIRD